MDKVYHNKDITYFENDGSQSSFYLKESHHSGFLAIDSSYNIKSYNQSFLSLFKALFGVNFDDSDNFIKLIPIVQRELWLRQFDTIKKSKTKIYKDLQDSLQNLFFSLEIRPYSIQENETGFLILINDITKQKNKVIKLNRRIRKLTLRSKQLEASVRDKRLPHREHNKNIDHSINELRFIKQTADLAPFSVIITDSQGYIVHANNLFTSFTGYNTEEIIGKKASILKSGFHPYNFYEQLWKTIVSGNKWESKICNKKKDGTYFWEQMTIFPLKKSETDISYFVSFNEPLNQVSWHRDKPQSFEVYYHQLINKTHNGNLLLDQEGIIVSSNESFNQLLGYESNEIQGRPIYDFIAGKGKTIFFSQYKDQFKNGNIGHNKISLKNKSGQEIDVILSGTAFPTLSEQPIMHCIIVETTMILKTEKELKWLRSFNESLLSSMYEGLIWEDSNGLFLYSNQSMSRLTGYTNQELTGMHWSQITHPDYVDIAQKAKKRRTQGVSDSYEFVILDKNQKPLDVLVSGTPLFEDGKYTGLLAVFTDIRQLKQKERDLNVALQKAQQSDKLKSEFLANISHEIRTPMNAILGFSEILKEKKDLSDLEKEEYFNIIAQKGDDLLNILSDIIDFSKMGAGIFNFNIERFSLNTFLSELNIEYQKIKEYKEKQNIELKIELPESDTFLETDKTHLKQILNNLYQNALKFTNSGFIQVGYQIEDTTILFSVKDTGIGIPQCEIKNIFKRFQRVLSDLNINEGGTGLGLAIVKHTLKHMQGKIWVESSVGIGSTFYFRIPRIYSSDAQ